MRESAGDAAMRHRMVRLAVLPAAIVAVTASAVIAFVMRDQGGVDATGAPASATLWGVLAGSLLLTCAVVVGAALFASTEARTTVERYGQLRRSSERGQTEVRAQLRRLEQGERPRIPGPPPELEPAGDALDRLGHELTLAQHTAEAAVAEAAALVRAGSSGSDEKVEVFVNLARRLQSLVHREIELLDELENEVEDPDLLKGLFHVDHLATRIRRHAENLAVLGGAVSRRQWTRPVTMTEVLRSSIAEVEQYSRVKLVPPIEGTLRGHAVADVIHLLAELVENATIFSAPQTTVLLRAQHVTAGLAVEVEDRGLGMDANEQNRMNALLADPEQFDVGELLSDGRIGLFVVSALARRHGIVVQLQSNIYGGIQAVLVLPRPVLGDTADTSKQSAAQPAQPAQPVPAAVPQRTGVPQGQLQSAQHGYPLGHPQGQEHQRAAAPNGVPQQQPGQPPQPVHHGQPQSPAPQIPAQTHGRARPQEAEHVRAPAPESVRAGGPPPGPPQQPPPRAQQPAPPPAAAPGERPQLPKRRRQEHLVPELRDGPRAQVTTDEPDAGHDPGLMAAFRRGTSLADESDGTDETHPTHTAPKTRPPPPQPAYAYDSLILTTPTHY
ncbi:ATP-binding protein [Streptomyces armeniacus]|uniref:histidine kinase n=1 Tax=Streptomyces armeniacus TaxID=83291 RepID=A0A345XLT8_9ACTN|nr:ATP-binding protein [Streptomyces armeniacus]AXK32604.1 ATP-binding protein [Streptomyces armeniacus]